MAGDSALSGLRVVELGSFIAAPYCAKLLADLGAEVLKVEPPQGDSARRYGPFRDDRSDAEASGLFCFLNGNKRGITLDLTDNGDQALLDNLLADADILVENLEHRDLVRNGLLPEQLTARHPHLIVTSISPFGRTGPHAHFRGHGLQASAGSTVAQRTGDPQRSPLAKPLNEPDFLGGVHAAAATLLAVRMRESGGPGQHIDVSLQDILASITSGQAVASVAYGLRAPANRSGHRVMAFFPWTVLPVADGYMEFITMQDRHWQSFIEEIGSPDWAKDERFQNKLTMPQHAEELESLMLAAIGHRTRADLWAAWRRRGISFQPVHRIDELVKSEHLKLRGYFVETSDGHGVPMIVPGAPYALTETPWQLARRAPRLGEHNEEVRQAVKARSAELGIPNWGTPVVGRRPATDERSERGSGAFDSETTPPERFRAPLAGVRVLDLGQVWAGPLLGVYLSDFGAEVIKVETLARLGMQSGASAPQTDPSQPISYDGLHRNRRSVSLNLAEPEGRELFLRLVAVSDVVFDNLSPRAVQKLGIGYEHLRAVNPALIVASMSAAGQEGPWADVLTYGPSLTALFGIKSLLGYAGDTQLQEDVADLDPTAATYAMVAILAALRHRDRTGLGQFIDMAQGEAGTAMLAEAVLEYTLNGRVLGPTGNRHRVIAPHGIYPTLGEDAWISIAVDSDGAWQALCSVLDAVALAADPRFSDSAGRLQHQDELEARLGEHTAGSDAWELTRRLQELGVAAYPVHNAYGVIADEQLAYRRSHIRITAPELAAASLFMRPPWNLSAAPPTISGPTRSPGADNDRMLGDLLGLSGDEFARFAAVGGIG